MPGENCPNMDIDDVVRMINSADDHEEIHTTPLGWYMRAMYQVFGLARLHKDGQIEFKAGVGTRTCNAQALEQLCRCRLVECEIDGLDDSLTYTLTDEGLKICRWMLEGKRVG